MSTRLKNTTARLLFVVAYAAILGLGMASLLHIFGMMLGASLDHRNVTNLCPYFMPFCLIAGFLALIALIGLLVLNVHVSGKYGYTKVKWVLQSLAVLPLSVPMMKLWELLFDFLRATF